VERRLRPGFHGRGEIEQCPPRRPADLADFSAGRRKTPAEVALLAASQARAPLFDLGLVRTTRFGLLGLGRLLLARRPLQLLALCFVLN
jgi:hypothetical protein